MDEPNSSGTGTRSRLLASWASARQEHRPFTIPGHKGRGGVFGDDMGDLLSSDVPLYGGLDTVKLSGGRLAAAERTAAELWNADWLRFSTGGSTHGNQTALVAVAQLPGEGILVARNAHRSVLSGLILTDLVPSWLEVEVDARFGIPLGVTPDGLQRALSAGRRPKAVFLTEPSYLGATSDVAALIALAHEHEIPVIIDQAWGAHFGFHPDVPPHSLSQGADVMICSAHKTLPAYSQACLVMARTELVPAEALETAFELSHTTSPAGSILASIDESRAILAESGHALLQRTVLLVERARTRLEEVRGVRVPGPEDFPGHAFDPTKLVVSLAGAGIDGVAVEKALLERGFPIEMADKDTLVPIVTIADAAEDVEALTDALVEALAAAVRGPSRALVSVSRSLTEQVLTPRQAFMAPKETVSWEQAPGRVSAEIVAPYPPGVPALVPGELITREILVELRALAASGTRVAYAADETLNTIRVVRDEPVKVSKPGGVT